MPLTTPVPVTVAVEGLAVDQVPPGEASANVIVAPAHTCVGPVMADGTGYTVTVSVAVQPVGSR